LSNGIHEISVKLFNASKSPITVSPTTIQSRWVQIDNGWPTAAIEQVLHSGTPVGACAMVTSGADAFTFVITADDPEQHLLSWNLTALWGANKSKAVASDNYSNHLPGPLWAGITSTAVPPAAGPPPSVAPWVAAVTGDPTSTQCAHTFYLDVWDRTINGYSYIHESDYSFSLTIDL
jgi:hypothetical protein